MFSLGRIVARFTLWSFLAAGIGGCAGAGTSLPNVRNAPPAASGVSKASRRAAGAIKAQTSGVTYAAQITGDHPAVYYQLSDANSTMVDSGPNQIAGSYGTSVSHQALPLTAGASNAAGFIGGITYNPSGFASTAPNAVLEPPVLSLEAWIECSQASPNHPDIPIVAYGDADTGFRYALSLHAAVDNTNSLIYVQQNVGLKPLVSIGALRLALGVPYHVVVTFDGTSVTTYVNGAVEQVSSYPGRINDAIPVASGLQIGGELRDPVYGTPPFPGTIAQVAVYPFALSQQQVLAHYFTGQLNPAATETAASADGFVDSIGVNTHFENQYSTYAQHFDQAAALLSAAGIRHIRAGMLLDNATYYANMKQLGAAGVNVDYITSLSATQSQLHDFASAVSPSLEYYEAPNEQDDPYTPNWASQCSTFEQTLYGWIKNDPTLSSIPLIGPSLTRQTSFVELGDQSAYLDLGNLHDYFANHNPGNPGYGSLQPYGIYGSISYNVNLAKVVSGSKPLVATESGYGTGIGYQAIDFATDLRYMTRLFFEQYRNGIGKTYSYEFIDNTTFPFMGILQNNLTPKPAYYGIKSLIAALADPGSPFTPSSLQYIMSGSTNNVHHVLLQKRNGTFVLALWIETESWNTVIGGDIVVPTQQVTIATAEPFSAATLSVMDETGNFSTTPVAWSGNAGVVNVTDKVTLLNLSP